MVFFFLLESNEAEIFEMVYELALGNTEGLELRFARGWDKSLSHYDD